MNEIAIQKVLEYIDSCLFEPARNWPKCVFEERSNARWAANEILQRLMDHPFDPPCEVVESFMLEMTLYSCVSKRLKNAILFSIATDVAEDILYLIS